jgi:hypothetical protein
MWWNVSSTTLMDPMGKDSFEFDGMETLKKTILGNKRTRFLGILFDATGDLKILTARLPMTNSMYPTPIVFYPRNME